MSVHQSAFVSFDQKIKLDWHDESAILRDKRDAVLSRLTRAGVSHRSFNQGSYAMRTGILPEKSDYDIDVAVFLTGNGVGSLTAKAAKQIVYDAVQGHTSQVKWLTNCVRVQYVKSGEPTYHIDLAVYREHSGIGTPLALARGKQFAATSEWIPGDPQRFLDLFDQRFSGNDRDQYRRVIRALKRWKDVNFSSEGNAAPIGVGIAMSAYLQFVPVKTFAGVYDDLAACLQLVTAMRNNFSFAFGPDQSVGNRLVAKMPVAPFDDVYRKMTNQQMKEFYQRLEKLTQQLSEAQRMGLRSPLVKAFGSDFPSS